MPTNGQTTLVRRVLERRAEKITVTEEGTTATVAVMVRVLPPPKALCAFADALLRRQMEDQITADLLDTHFTSDESEAVRLLDAEFWPVVMTDSVDLVRRVRAHPRSRAPFVLYVSELDEAHEREAGLIAGADDCVGRRASNRELAARIAASRRIAELESVLRITLEENRKLSATDDLTRTASRRFFGKHFPREVERAARYGRALALVLCDIDHFKNINDTLGHPGGDQILKQFGRRLQEVLRRGVDWVARIGGEEFAIVLPETEYERALDVARKLRAKVAECAFGVEGKTIRVTASFGLCGLDRVPAGERRLAERMLKIADQALYRSKETGRNRVTATLLNRQAGGATAPASARPHAERQPEREEAREPTRVVRAVRIKYP
jgi:diguanylate cyclase (GGDEF)-like protein